MTTTEQMQNPIAKSKIYTRRGDSGKTSLFDGSRVDKFNIRCELLGEIDELNSAIGASRDLHLIKYEKARVLVEEIQSSLFDLGAHIAAPTVEDGGKSKSKVTEFTAQLVPRVESLIDELEEKTGALVRFILPRGDFNLVRAICRRVERTLVKASTRFYISPDALSYVNRLSDFFFALARYINHLQNRREVEYICRSRSNSVL
jgi:cob(I)alamin adenosyltransferase